MASAAGPSCFTRSCVLQFATMIYIRGTHPYAFRSGEWAHLFSIQHNDEGQDLWVVEFDDGEMDVWPSWDVLAGYDVKVQIEPITIEESNDNQEYEGGGAATAAAKLILANLPSRTKDPTP